MKTHSIAILAVISILALFTGAPRLLAAQPHMDEAIRQLELASTAKFPIEHLEKAKIQLELASKDKGGERETALMHVREAIDAARKREPRRMEDHIAKAIKDVREGKRNAAK